MGTDTTAGLSAGVRRRRDRAQRCCAALRGRAANVAASFDRLTSPFLESGEGPADLQPMVLLVVRMIEKCLGWLLAAEETYQSELAGLAAARQRRDAAIAAVRAQIGSFRDVGLRGPRLPVVPAGEIPQAPHALLAAARTVARRLRNPKLRLAPGIAAGIRLYPRLRTDFDDAVAELEAAVAEIGRREQESSTRRADRDRAMAELDFQLALGGRLGRYLDVLVRRPGKGAR